MTFELALIAGFISHLIGDYIFQNDWMALNKKSNWLPCFIHCVLYSIPFYVFLGSGYYIWIIFITHYLIDRYHFVDWFLAVRNGVYHIKNFGFSESRPKIISVWLYIITDNIFHLLFNSFAIYLHIFYKPF